MKLSKQRTVWSILIVAISICAVLSITVARTVKLKPRPNQQSVAHGPAQNIRFTLYDAGIFPQQQHAKPGNVSINLEDRTHQSAGLVVQREAGGMSNVVGHVRSVSNQARGRTQFSLGVGH